MAGSNVRTVTRLINDQARDKAPGGPYSTGRLKSSIHWSISHAGQVVVGQSGSDLDYAIFPERGTRPHDIYPRTAPALRFFWRRVGRTVRLAHVSHPGSAAQNFMTNALLQIAPRYGYRVFLYYR